MGATDHNLVFVLPEGFEQPTGGNIYDANLCRALSRLTAVRCSSTAEWRQLVERGADGTYLVDTLDLDQSDVIERRRSGQRFVLIVHYLPSLEPEPKPKNESIEREMTALRRFDAWLVTSSFTRDHLLRLGLPRERIVTVPPCIHGVPAESVATAPPVRGLVVGNLIPVKGILELFSVLDRLTLPGDPYTLDVFGRIDIDAKYAERCAEAVRGSESLSARARIRGVVPHDAMPALYDASHVLLSASRMETFGMALAEARAHGLVVFAIDGGNAKEHATGGAGHIFSTVPALAGAFLELARDPSRLGALRRIGREAPTSGGTWDDRARSFLEQLTSNS